MKDLLQSILRTELDKATTINELLLLTELAAELNNTWDFPLDWYKEFICDVEFVKESILY